MMKKRVLPFILLCLALASAITTLAQSHTTTVNGVKWTYKLNGNNATITSNYSAPSDYNSWYDATSTQHLGTYTGVIKIPATLDGHPVTAIQGGAFDGSSAKGFVFEETTQGLNIGERVWKADYGLGSPLQYIDMTGSLTVYVRFLKCLIETSTPEQT